MFIVFRDFGDYYIQIHAQVTAMRDKGGEDYQVLYDFLSYKSKHYLSFLKKEDQMEVVARADMFAFLCTNQRCRGGCNMGGLDVLYFIPEVGVDFTLPQFCEVGAFGPCTHAH